MSLVENIQRQDLNAMEIATSLQRLIDECGITQDTVASRVGKKRSTVANYLRLLALPMEVQLAVKEELITMGHAKAIASASAEVQVDILKKVVKKGMSVRQTEEYVKKINETATNDGAGLPDEDLPDSYTHLVEHFSRIFSDDIKIRKTRGGGGKIVIGFSSDDDIDQFISKLQKLQ